MPSTSLKSAVEEEFLDRCNNFQVRWKKRKGKKIADISSLPLNPPEEDAFRYYLSLEGREQEKLRALPEFREALRYLKNRGGYQMLVFQVLVTLPQKERQTYLN